MAGGAVALSPVTAIAGGAVLLAVLALVLGPLAVLGANTGAGLGPADWAAIRFTLVQSALSAGLSALIAVPFARALMRRRFAGRQAIVALLGAPFLLPVIVAVLGLLAVWGRSGALSELSQVIGGPMLSIYGLTGVVLAHVFFNVPLVARLLIQGWQQIPEERFRLAAQLGMGPGAVFRWLEWPMLRAVLPGAVLLVFLLCMTSFAVALALGGGPRATTVELAIYQALRFDFDLGKAALLALVQFGLCAVVAALALLTGRPAGFGRGVGRPPRRWDAPKRRLWDVAVIVTVVLFLGTPMIFVILRGLAALSGDVPSGLWQAAFVSLRVALLSALAATLAALALAALISALPRGRGAVVEGAGLLMLSASPFVVGTGLFIVLRPITDPFDWALVVTGTINAAMSLPFALRVLVPALGRVRDDYGRLADNLGLTGMARLRLVTLPLIRPALGFAAGLAAALSMGDLGVITLFAPPETATLPLYMYQLMGAYRMDQAAGAALLLLVLSLALFWIIDRGGRLGHPA